MTQVVAEAVEQVERKVPVWEDFVDIFTSPSAVFSRRSGGQFGVALLVITLAIGFLAVAGVQVLAPIFDAEFNRAMLKNPQLPMEQVEKMRSLARWGALSVFFVFPLSMLVVGLVLRLAGALFDATLTVKAAIMIAVYAQAPRVVQQFVSIVQGFLMAPESLNSRYSISASPARFLDAASTSPVLLALLERFDLFTLWATVLLVIGLRVVGRIPAGRAALAAALVWVLGSLFPLMGAVGQMRAGG